MNTTSLTVTPSVGGVASSILGLCFGYAAAPRKYTLERFLMQDEASLKKNFSSDSFPHASSSEKKSFENLNKASKEYFNSGTSVLREQIKPNAKRWADMVRQVKVEDSFVNSVDLAKQSYLQALKESDYFNLKRVFNVAKQKSLNNPKDSVSYLEMKAAAVDFANAQLKVKPFAQNYKKARAEFRFARSCAFLKLPDDGYAIFSQWDKVRSALSDRANVMYEKLAALSEDKSLKNDYAAIKKYIPKARTSSAVIGAIVAGGVGILATLFMQQKNLHNS